MSSEYVNPYKKDKRFRHASELTRVESIVAVYLIDISNVTMTVEMWRHGATWEADVGGRECSVV
jgi:hypothetical protein